MELKVLKEAAIVNETLCEYTDEQAIESDILLPDYCPEAARILKCTGETVITEKRVLGDKVTVEGVALIKVYYVNEKSGLSGYDVRIPFSKSCDLKNAADEAIVIAGSRIGYLHCRAVNQRRIYIKGSVVLKVKVVGQKSVEIVQDAYGSGIQIKKEESSMIRVIGDKIERIEVSEELELAYGKESPQDILNVSILSSVTDSKIIANKAIIRGELNIKIVYNKEDGAGIDSMEYVLPVSKIVDMEGLDEECKCNIGVKVASYNVSVISSEEGAGKFAFEAELAVEIRAVRENGLSYATDSYSTICESEMSFENYEFMKYERVLQERAAVKSTVDFPEEVSKIMQVWSEKGELSIIKEDGINKMAGENTICVLAVTSEEQVIYFEKKEKFEYSLEPTEIANSVLDINFNVENMSYSIVSGERAEIRYDVTINGSVFNVMRRQCISDISINESEGINVKRAALTAYYADADEKIWDIAKKYRTSVSAVKEENGIQGETAGARVMLFIPTVR